MGSLSLTVNMFTSLLVSGLGLVSAVSAQAGCPEPYGLQVYPHEQYCDKFYKCANVCQRCCLRDPLLPGSGLLGGEARVRLPRQRPTATSRRSPWWGSSVQPHTSYRQTLWQEDSCLSQDSLNLVMKLPT